MKAVVMEIKNEYAVVLKEDGTFYKIKKDCKVGETIELSDKAFNTNISLFKPKNIAKVAAVALVVIGLSGSYYNVAVASDYMVVSEGEEEVTIGLNNFGKVVSVKSETPEGKIIVKDLYDKGIKYDDVENAIAKVSISLKDINQRDDMELKVKIDARNDKRYKHIEKQVINAGGTIQEHEPQPVQDNVDTKVEPQVEEQTAPQEEPKTYTENNQNQDTGSSEQNNQTEPSKQEQPTTEKQPAGQTKPAQESQPSGQTPQAPEGQPSGQTPQAPEGQPSGQTPQAPESQPSGQTPQAPESQPSGQTPQAPEGQPSQQSQPTPEAQPSQPGGQQSGGPQPGGGGRP